MADGLDLIPPLPELRDRLLDNIREGRILRELIKIAEKENHVYPSGQRPRPDRRRKAEGVAG